MKNLSILASLLGAALVSASCSAEAAGDLTLSLTDPSTLVIDRRPSPAAGERSAVAISVQVSEPGGPATTATYELQVRPGVSCSDVAHHFVEHLLATLDGVRAEVVEVRGTPCSVKLSGAATFAAATGRKPRQGDPSEMPFEGFLAATQEVLTRLESQRVGMFPSEDGGIVSLRLLGEGPP